MWRIKFIKIFLVIIYIVITVNLFTLQLTSMGKLYRERGVKQSLKQKPLPPERGEILDRKLHPVATSIPVLRIYQTGNPVKSRKILLKYGIHPKKFKNRRKYFLLIGEIPFISSPLPQLVNDTNLYQEIVLKRFYPYHNTGSGIIGAMGKDRALGGLEYCMDFWLKGKEGVDYFYRDARGNILKFPQLDFRPPKKGKNLIITLDFDLEDYIYQLLKETVKEKKAKGGFVIVTNPQTAEVLALVNYPTHDPNDAKPTKNKAIEDPYEPGSTFKIVPYTYAFMNGIISPNDSVETGEGYIVVEGKTIRDVHALGKISFRDAIIYSSNVAASKLGLLIGPKGLYTMAQNYGIGAPTGSILQGESFTRLKKLSEWKKSYTANFAMGYGILVNGLQMAMAYGAIANGGILYAPRFILNHHEPVFIRRVMPPEVADTMKNILEDVVEKGTGHRARIPGIAICGKTGTSKVYDPSRGRYDSRRIISSFIGFFPKNEPQYLIYVVIFEPQGPPYTLYGGQIAAPLFREIAEFLIKGDTYAAL